MLDPIFIIGMVIPILIAGGAALIFHGKVTPFEAACQALIVLAVVGLSWAGGRYSDTGDVETWNGQVTRKQARTEQCPWGWNDSQDDFCTEYRTRKKYTHTTCSTTGSGSKKRKTCTKHYKTQYEYLYAWERRYFVYTNVKADFEIPRVDRQGVQYPPVFTAAYEGQPASANHTYTNWIRGASENVFHEDGAAEEKYLKILPQYPNYVYDYYKVDHVVRVGNVKADLSSINKMIAEKLKDLGPQRQMNAIIVLVDTKIAGDDFPYAVRRYWQGFKKNDAVVFLGLEGTPQGSLLRWVNIMSWSKKSIFDVELREAINIQRGSPIDYSKVINDLHDKGMKLYERREMKEFEYLKDQIPVPTWLTILVLVVSVIGSGGLTLLFHRIDFNPFKK